MKARIKFNKTGSLKFIGHLDVMRYFQKAFRRAEIDVEYSQGYSPHQLMSFAAPLGVGLTSDGEYLDVSLLSCDEPGIMMERINNVMVEEIKVTSFRILPEDSKNAMSIVAGADYMVSVKDGYEFMDKDTFEEQFSKFYNQEFITILKKSKKSENEVDIKPMMYHIAFTRDGFYEQPGQGNMETDSVAEVYDNGIKVYMKLATGSVNNLKPELVMEAFSQYCDRECNQYAYQVHRLEVYGDASKDGSLNLIALNQI